jgi:hypothetical protein
MTIFSERGPSSAMDEPPVRHGDARASQTESTCMAGATQGYEAQQQAAGPPPPNDVPSPPCSYPHGNLFRHYDSGAWLVVFGEDGTEVKPFKHGVPFFYLRALLAVPGVPHPPILLREMVESDESIHEYRQRLALCQRGWSSELTPCAEVDLPGGDGVDINISDGDAFVITWQDLRRLEREMRAVQTEMDDLRLHLRECDVSVEQRERMEASLAMGKRQLAEKQTYIRSVSYKGRPLKFPNSPRERARTLVCKHIRAAIELLRKGGMVRMSQHLDRHIQNKGTEPVYYGDQVFCT